MGGKYGGELEIWVAMKVRMPLKGGKGEVGDAIKSRG